MAVPFASEDEPPRQRRHEREAETWEDNEPAAAASAAVAAAALAPPPASRSVRPLLPSRRSPVVAYLESIRVRRRDCCRRRRRAEGKGSGSNSGRRQRDDEHAGEGDPEVEDDPNLLESTESVPLISGLSAVIRGTVPASASVKICDVRPPQYLFYMLSGSGCDAVQLVLDYGIHRCLRVRDPSTCWAVSFTLSIAVRHTSHRYLVFGPYVGGYWRSLGRMYGGYSASIILSTIFNVVITKYISHYAAWVVTLLWTGVVNYFVLKRLWTFGGGKGGGSSDDGTGKKVDADVLDHHDPEGGRSTAIINSPSRSGAGNGVKERRSAR